MTWRASAASRSPPWTRRWSASARAGSRRGRGLPSSDGELVDLPRAPLPDGDTPAPPRLLPTFDATLLTHARRTGLLPEEYRPRIFSTRTPQSLPTFLVDGRVAGTWRHEDGAVRLEPVRAPGRGGPARARGGGRGDGGAVRVTGRSAAADGFRLAYDRLGDGPPVVLLHGWPGGRGDRREVAARLADAADVIVPDLRGFGESDRPAGAAGRVRGRGPGGERARADGRAGARDGGAGRL